MRDYLLLSIGSTLITVEPFFDLLILYTFNFKKSLGENWLIIRKGLGNIINRLLKSAP